MKKLEKKTVFIFCLTTTDKNCSKLKRFFLRISLGQTNFTHRDNCDHCVNGMMEVQNKIVNSL